MCHRERGCIQYLDTKQKKNRSSGMANCLLSFNTDALILIDFWKSLHNKGISQSALWEENSFTIHSPCPHDNLLHSCVRRIELLSHLLYALACLKINISAKFSTNLKLRLFIHDVPEVIICRPKGHVKSRGQRASS